MDQLIDLIYLNRSAWSENIRSTFSQELQTRYPRIQDITTRNNSEKRFQLRLNASIQDDSVPYVALIPPDQELSGAYGGMSFVLFPSDEDGMPALICMVVGTNGLAPDEEILGRPGHARKCAAIMKWLNAASSSGFGWAKHDPVRIDLDLPEALRGRFDAWARSIDRYGKVIYACWQPPAEHTTVNEVIVRDALTAFIDLFFEERHILVKKSYEADAKRIRQAWMKYVFPELNVAELTTLLRERRFVIIEGPPGTGKTRLARQLFQEVYKGYGREIQFHPGTTYESFIGGLAPQSGGALGFTFEPTAGHLMQVCLEAFENPEQRYLLLIDEINRADLAKVLGEAIYLFEPGQPDRSVYLPYHFCVCGNQLWIPPNLDVIGTMNSADRSIAILDVAVRRRFAFVPLWPSRQVVEEHSGPLLSSAFELLMKIFVEHAPQDALALLPGHAYFLGNDEQARMRLTTEVAPLLEEYLAQGFVAGFSDEVRAYLDLIIQHAAIIEQ